MPVVKTHEVSISVNPKGYTEYLEKITSEETALSSLVAIIATTSIPNAKNTNKVSRAIHGTLKRKKVLKNNIKDHVDSIVKRVQQKFEDGVMVEIEVDEEYNKVMPAAE
jgi:transcriptional regulator NrdR family protein